MTTIEVILGCMFSGKTTELIRRISRYQAINKPVLCINHSIDTRAKSNSIKTHEGRSIPALKTNKLIDIVVSVEYNNSEVIGIDEAQFFEDLIPFVKHTEKLNKKLIICGLDGDYKREPIGDILKCIPLADSVIKLTALDPKDGTPAIFTQRKDKINKDQILVGGQNEYCAVSRKNYEF
jgi:thymidine kinase